MREPEADVAPTRTAPDVAPGARARVIAVHALPIIGGLTFQNLLSLFDALLVAPLGDDALAAVGISSFVHFMAMAMVQGLGAGVQAVSARRFGEGQTGVMARPLNGGLLLALAIGVPITLGAWLAAPALVGFLVKSESVQEIAVPYLRMRLFSVTAMGLHFAFRGYWSAVNRSLLYFVTLLSTNLVNLGLNAGLIYGYAGLPELGVTGAGLGSAIATWLGAFAYLLLGLRYARAAGFLHGLPDRATMSALLSTSIPASIQQVFFAAGMTVLYAIIGRIGTRELASAHVITNLLLIAIMPGLGFGITAAAFVGQSLGRGEPAAARRWAWDVSRFAVVAIALLVLPLAIFSGQVLQPFLRDATTRAVAQIPLVVVLLGLPIDTLGLVLMNALLGAGDSRTVLYVTVAFQWLLLLPAAYAVGPWLGLGLLAVYVVQLVVRGAQAGVFVVLWKRGAWERVKV